MENVISPLPEIQNNCNECGQLFLLKVKDKNGKKYRGLKYRGLCETCYAARFVPCCRCEEKADLQEYTYDGKVFCQDCFYEEYFLCERCDSHYYREQEYCLGDSSYCLDCYDNISFTCSRCDEREHNEYGNTYRRRTYCQTCWEEGFTTCQNCGDVLRNDDICGEGYCENCVPEEEEDDTGGDNIRDAHYRPDEFIFCSRPNEKSPLYFGLELEVANQKKIILNNEAAGQVLSLGNHRLFTKSDSSIIDGGFAGFEIVSHPATMAYHIQDMAWAQVTNYLSQNGFVSHNNTSCGLHIHVNKSFFSQAELCKLALFVHGNQAQLSKLARRTSASYARFKDKKAMIIERDFANKEARSRNGLSGPDTHYGRLKKYEVLLHNPDRYEAVNFLNDETVEFRLYKGTLRANTIFATIELTDAICRFVKCHNTTQINGPTAWGSLSSFIDKGNYKFLRPYMNSRGVK